MESTVYLTGNIYKHFAKYVSLNVISMIGLSCYILADTLFIANKMGSLGLTSLNLALPVYSLINGSGLMLGMGAATKYSILRGQNRNHRANRAFTQAVAISLVIGVILTVIGIFFTHDIAVMLGADEGTSPLVNDYLKTILIFSCAFIINNIMVCFVRNDNDPNLAMAAMLTGSISNIILDYIFIFPMNLGMFGAAFATGLAPIFSMAVLSLHWIRKNNNFRFIKCRFCKKSIFRIISIGFPSFINEISSGIVMLLFNFAILRLAGNTGVAAYGIIANLALIAVAVFTGIAQGIQPILSVNYGTGNFTNVKKILRASLILSAVTGTVFYLCGIIFSEEIIRIFNSEQNRTLMLTATSGIRLYFTSFIIMGINIITSSFFSSVAQPRESFIISLMRGLVVVVPAILLLPYLLNISGVWLTIPLTELITLVVSIYSLKRYNKDLPAAERQIS